MTEIERPEVGWKYRGVQSGTEYEVTAVGRGVAILAWPDGTEYTFEISGLADGEIFERIDPEGMPQGVGNPPGRPDIFRFTEVLYDGEWWLDVWGADSILNVQTECGEIVEIPADTLRWMIDRAMKGERG